MNWFDCAIRNQQHFSIEKSREKLLKNICVSHRFCISLLHVGSTEAKQGNPSDYYSENVSYYNFCLGGRQIHYKTSKPKVVPNSQALSKVHYSRLVLHGKEMFLPPSCIQKLLCSAIFLSSEKHTKVKFVSINL